MSVIISTSSIRTFIARKWWRSASPNAGREQEQKRPFGEWGYRGVLRFAERPLC